MDSEWNGSRPVRDVEVRAITYRRFGLRRHCGHLEYRTLATRGDPYGSLWLDYAKSSWPGTFEPLCRARTRERLMEKLRTEAAVLGHVASFVEVHHA